MKNPKKEFIKLIYEMNKSRGLDELVSKIISILYVEPKEISLDELAKRTGYSLSAVSTTMKLLANSGVIKKFKKPKSKKVYFYMEKDILSHLIEAIRKNFESIKLVKEKMPEIIDSYKKLKISKEELMIATNYYKQILIAERVMKKVLAQVGEVKV